MNKKNNQQWYIGVALIVMVIVIFIIALSRPPETNQTEVDSTAKIVQAPATHNVRKVDSLEHEESETAFMPTPQPVEVSRAVSTQVAEETPMMNVESSDSIIVS